MCANVVNRRLGIVCLSIVVVWGCDREPSTAPIPVAPPADTVERVSRIVIITGPSTSLKMAQHFSSLPLY
jgi:hypothetical protein